MTLNEGIEHMGTPFIIPDSSRDNLPDFFVSRGYKVGAEIGVWRGNYTEQFCKVGLKMYAIDQWKAIGGQGPSQGSQRKQGSWYKEACERLSSYDCVIICDSSMKALSQINDQSLDFVYIDGDHSLPHIINDIWWWSLKVRTGGIIAGHDYFYTKPGDSVLIHVEPAVKVYTQVCGINNFWVFGGFKLGEMDGSPSWMWFKP